MRRRKKDKTQEKVTVSSADDALESSGRGRSTKSSKNVDAQSRSPVQQRKRSLLGLGSVRDLVEQVQDSLTKTKQDPSAAASSTLGGVAGSSTNISAEKTSKHASSSNNSGSTPPDKGAPDTPAAQAATPAEIRAISSVAAAGMGSGAGGVGGVVAGAGGGAAAVAVSTAGVTAPPAKKKVLDLKLLSSGASLSLRMKKQVAFTPSPSEFKPRERPDATDQPFCGVCAGPFTLMVRRQRCQVCGESVCAHCSSDKRHVEGQKGLQRVCDICIVEGPVVLDENGMYAVGPSPAATPIATPRRAPSSTSTSASTITTTNTTGGGRTTSPYQQQQHAPASASASAPAPPPAPPSTASSYGNSNSTSASRQRGGAGSGMKGPVVRSLFSDSRGGAKSAPVRASSGSNSGSSSSSSNLGGGSGGANNSGARPARPPRSPIAAGAVGPGSRAVGGGAGVGSSAGTAVPVAVVVGKQPADTVASARDRGEVPDAEDAAVMGEDEDGDVECCGQPSSAAPAKGRKRSKKGRRAGAAAETRASADKKQWSGQSFGDYIGSGGSGGGGSGTPASRSSRSTPRGGSGASGGVGFSTGSVAASTAVANATGGGGCASGVGGGGSKGKWESTGKRRGSGSGAGEEEGQTAKPPRQAVGQGSGFVRDFIRGAGIHRLDPRRLVGPLTLCASRTGLGKLWSAACALLRFLLDDAQDRGRGGGGGRSRRAGGGRGGGSGHYSSHHNSHYHQMGGWGSGRRWRPGRRAIVGGSMLLLASYRRYQVTHPEVTTEHVLGAATSVFLALVGFLAHAVTDLARDACGAVIPSLCGTREARLAAALGGARARRSGMLEVGGAAAEGGVGRAVGSVAVEGDDGAVPGIGVEGHDLDRYFIV